MNDVKLPFSDNMELGMLCSIYKNPEIVDSLAFREEMFYIPANRLMFRQLVEVYTEHGKIDWILFKDSFTTSDMEEVGGVGALDRMVSFIPTSALYSHYYEQIRELYQRRESWIMLTKLADKCLDKDVDYGGQSFQDTIERGMSSINLDKPIPDIPLDEDLSASLDAILKRRPGSGMIELSSIRALNLSMGCLLPGDMVVIGADTSFGKTSLAMHFVSHISLGQQRKKVAIFSMEMRKQSLHERLFAAQTSIPLDTIRRNDLSLDQIARMKDFIDQVKEKQARVFLDDSATVDITSIVSRCRRLKNRFGLDVAVVDYLQLVSPANLKSNANRQQEVADISRRLKMLAVELNLVVIALSQLNESGQLRESRAIGQDADIVMHIHEGKSDDSFERQIYIEKNRNGPRGQKVPVHFYPQYVSFGDKT